MLKALFILLLMPGILFSQKETKDTSRQIKNLRYITEEGDRIDTSMILESFYPDGKMKFDIYSIGSTIKRFFFYNKDGLLEREVELGILNEFSRNQEDLKPIDYNDHSIFKDTASHYIYEYENDRVKTIISLGGWLMDEGRYMLLYDSTHGLLSSKYLIHDNGIVSESTLYSYFRKGKIRSEIFAKITGDDLHYTEYEYEPYLVNDSLDYVLSKKISTSVLHVRSSSEIKYHLGSGKINTITEKYDGKITHTLKYNYDQKKELVSIKFYRDDEQEAFKVMTPLYEYFIAE